MHVVLQIFALIILFRTVYSIYDDEELFYQNSFSKRKQSASGLIPFPRVGRSEKSWRTNLDAERVNKKREGLIPFPRVGRSRAELTHDRVPMWNNVVYPEVDLATVMRKLYRYSFPRPGKALRSDDRTKKIEGLMPFPRVGRSSRQALDEPTDLSPLTLDFKIGRNDRYSTDSSLQNLIITPKDYEQNSKENGYESSRDTKSSLNDIEIQL